MGLNIFVGSLLSIFLAILQLLVAWSDASGPDKCWALFTVPEGDVGDSSGDALIPVMMERIHEIRVKYDDLFWRQPNVHGVGEGFLRDDQGEWIDTLGILILVTPNTKVDQSTLPEADRIPSCLEGVPVAIEEHPGAALYPPRDGPVSEDENGGTNYPEFEDMPDERRPKTRTSCLSAAGCAFTVGSV